MIGNYYFKVAVHLNMVLQILSILLELQSYEGLDTNYLASNVLISLSCLYFSVNSLLSLAFVNIVFPRPFSPITSMVDFLRDQSYGTM